MEESGGGGVSRLPNGEFLGGRSSHIEEERRRLNIQERKQPVKRAAWMGPNLKRRNQSLDIEEEEEEEEKAAAAPVTRRSRRCQHPTPSTASSAPRSARESVSKLN